MKAFIGLVGGVVLIGSLIALGWLLTANDLAQKKVFAPHYEQVRRETFEQSKAYVDGTVQELQNFQFQYVKATKDQQAGLADIILSRTANIDAATLPPDLRAFVQKLREERAGAR